MSTGNDQLTLGLTIGLPIAPSIRYGRIVGVLREDMPRYVVREFVPGDDAWPTGPTKILPRPFVLPWRGGS